ncbi:MAG: arylsulfatase [Akkermansiaceae bacterium]
MLSKLFYHLCGSVIVLTPLSALSANKPNIIYILADDLGYNELGSYGQKQIKTPNIDALAKSGIKFTQHYSGSAVCAPTRACFITGKHSGHSQVRNNSAGIFKNPASRKNPAGEGQYPLKRGTETIGGILQKAGYKTCAVGKWGLGGPFNEGSPNKQGFDHYFGYLCQRQAHNYFPTHLWRNDKMVKLDGNEGGKQLLGKHYAPDLINKEALEFIEKNHKQPFFLYYATIIPHVALQVPEDDPALAEYRKKWPNEKPYIGNRGYIPNKTPHATYAAMITRMDRYIGNIIAKLKKLGVYDNTLIIFTSDNGPTNAGGGGASYFNSAGDLRASKGSFYEGGIRVPFVASWTGKIKSGTQSDHISAGWDMLATFADIAGEKPNKETDGISLLPSLTGNGEQKKHTHLYWELGTQQAVRMDNWKAYRRAGGKVFLYDLSKDIGEKNNIADQHPEVLKKLTDLFTSSRTDNKDFKDPAQPREKRQKRERKRKNEKSKK